MSPAGKCTIVLCFAIVLAFNTESGINFASAQSIGYGVGEEEWRGEVNLLSWRPRLYYMKGFLSDSECEHLKLLATPKLRSSQVVDLETGKSTDSTSRSSKGAFFPLKQDQVVERIENRVAAVSMLSWEHQEGLSVLKYEDGQEYLAHHDYFRHEKLTTLKDGGQRFVTVLMYLSTPEEGGETVFPLADRKVSGPGWSDCALDGFAIKPVKGDAVMLYNLHPNGTEDDASLHGSCPTLKGEKWSATKWIRARPRTFGAWSRARFWFNRFDH